MPRQPRKPSGTGIHQNPVKAGIVDHVKDYDYSSWGEFDGTVEPVFQICDTQTVLNRLTGIGKGVIHRI